MQVPLYKHQDTGPVGMVVEIGGVLEHGRCRFFAKLLCFGGES